MTSDRIPDATGDIPTRKSELRAFLFITVLVAPILSVMVVGTFGLVIWIYQMFAGPPAGG